MVKPTFLCGSDNRTYSSLCRLDYHNCIHATAIKVACKGFCPCKGMTLSPFVLITFMTTMRRMIVCIAIFYVCHLWNIILHGKQYKYTRFIPVDKILGHIGLNFFLFGFISNAKNYFCLMLTCLWKWINVMCNNEYKWVHNFVKRKKVLQVY